MLLDLLLPRRCVICLRLGEDLCARCRGGLPLLLGAHCDRCGAPTAWPVLRCRECAGRRLAFASARAAVAYDSSVRAFVGAWKERARRRLADIAADILFEAVEPRSAAAIVFVPPDGDRSLRRGHHPAEQLARALAGPWELPVLDGLARVRPARRQRGLSLPERRRNVRGAFSARHRVPGLLLLVDDVYTTGSTASAAATALRKAGARRVDVVTFARAVRGIQSARRPATASLGGRSASPGEGQERRGHRLDP